MCALPLLKRNEPRPADLLGDAPVRSRAGREPSDGRVRALRAVRANREVGDRSEEMFLAQQILMEAQKAFPHDIWGQMGYFFSTFRIPAARGRKRAVSTKTTDKYVESLTLFLQALRQHENIRLRNLSEVSTKHLAMCFRRWEEEGLSASTLANRMTCIRRFMRWVGKGGGIAGLKEILTDPERGVRTYSAVIPLDWESRGHLPEDKIAEVESHCRYTAMHLKLQDAFGLRSAESLCLKPHESDTGDKLVVNRGTKGGRGRVVPIRTEKQRQVLDAAKAMANPRTGLVGRNGHNFNAARNHYYYVLSKCGITRRDGGITAHGLRHGYSNTRYEDMTGHQAPVHGGAQPDREIELAARRKVSLELGHTRPQITTAYTGSVIHIGRVEKRRIQQLLAQLTSQSVRTPYETVGRELGQHALRANLYVLGPDAEGKPFAPEAPLLVGIEIENTDLGAPPMKAGDHAGHVAQAIQTLAPAVTAATGRMAILADNRGISAEIARLEILY